MIEFADLSRFAATPRLTGLAVSHDGARLVAVLQQPDPAGARYTSSLWEIPLGEGEGEPSRLTNSDTGETSPAFLPDGSLLFVSSRPSDGQDADDPALWRLPPTGEATVLVRRAGGLSGPVVAVGSGEVLLAGSRLAYSTDDDDADRRATRKDRKIGAILHTGMPIRHWDHEVGDAWPRLLLFDGDSDPAGDSDGDSDGGGAELRDVAPDAAHQLLEPGYSISADGATIATSWRERRPRGRCPDGVAVIDVASGSRRMLPAPDGWELDSPALSPDAAWVAVATGLDATFERPPGRSLLIMSLADGVPIEPDLGDLRAIEWAWSPDSMTLFVAGDLRGRGAVLAVDVPSSATRVIVDDAAYSSLCPAPDGALYALRSAIDSPPQPVRVGADGQWRALPSPAPSAEPAGELIEVTVPTADGASVHGWLCLPADQGAPPPVMLWIHGGPFGSWNAWSWRWNPWVAVARGWAVVLPDPALSTGYGQAWLERAWPYVAAEVFADCEMVLDHAIAEHGLDGSRVACLGASFGGYLTNWAAGHVDRFGAIVTHAGLYALDQQHKTTDAAHYKTSLFGEPSEHPEWYQANSPHHGQVGATPMLVVHGNRDYRVPVSEALRLWWDLVEGWDGDPADLPHRFLQLTAENHWVLSPAAAEIWYDTVLGFCAEHVLGEEWTPSPLL